MTWLTELRDRGVQDVLIACCDGLKGLPESIDDIWLQAAVQLCIVHLAAPACTAAARQRWGKIATSRRSTRQRHRTRQNGSSEWGRVDRVVRLDV